MDAFIDDLKLDCLFGVSVTAFVIAPVVLFQKFVCFEVMLPRSKN